MHYIEIGQDIVDAIKGGANGSGKSDVEEATYWIGEFGRYFSQIVEMIRGFIEEISKAIKK